MDTLSKEKTELLLKLRALQTHVAQGEASLAQGLFLEPDELESTYQTGLYFLKRQDNEQAQHVFGILVILEPYKLKHWREYGLSLLRNKQYQAAQYALSAAQCLEEQDMATLAYLGETLILLGDKSKAKTHLSTALNKIQPGNTAHVSFYQYIQGLLKYV